ncbi:MAG: hypothetical protein OXH63_28005 [Gemmatimonadetes bacterium]|nr:hypothetical protein [Gemmatimonadota bacterium]
MREEGAGIFVFNLQQSLDPGQVGAKAANLAGAMEMGLSVPPGAVISRQALSLFLDRSGLLLEAQRLINGIELECTERAEAFEALCTEVMRAPIPEPIVEEVALITRPLLDETPYGLAVRSSGVYEDSARASFAGVYESFLGIRTEAELWRAVRRCWCASWAPQAIDYARRMGIQLTADGMSVLLQTLVRADSAGVLFTANPRTGNPWQFVLESSFGLARDLVASTSAAIADRFLIGWSTGEILERFTAEKWTQLVPGASGLDSVDIPEDRRAEPSLSDDLATRIAQAGLQIDRAFGTRVDVEWAVDSDDIHIVQVRPITALPAFFPHHLPAHLADRTWRPAKQWHFSLRRNDGTVTLPIYRDKLITEKFNRYLQVGPLETPTHRKCGAESDFHGHRYLVEDDSAWPQWPRIPASQREQYLVEFEPQMRADFLHDTNTRFPAIEAKAVRLENEANTLEQAIDAILWAQETMWDLEAVGVGPSQHLYVTCLDLLHAFVDEYLPNIDINDLTLGHHSDLDPYWPHVLIADAEEMAKLLEPKRELFEGLSLDELIRSLQVAEAPSPFISAFEACCERLCLVPPWQSHEGEAPHDLGARLRMKDILRLIRNALRGSRRISQIAEETSQRRAAVVGQVRETLAARSAELTRFERLHDWALFWGPALNHRILRGDVPSRKLHRLFQRMGEQLLATGLVDDVDDVVYFTVEDLKAIAVTGDIATGQGVLKKRRLECERSERLVVPIFLGKPPEGSPATQDHAAPTADKTEAGTATTIVGKPGGPGRSKGIVRRIETLAEGDEVAGEEDIAVLVTPVQSNNNDMMLVFSMLLRVRGLVVPDDLMMWTAHIGQIARECHVPVVEIAPSDLDRLFDGCPIELDGTRGVLTLLDT